MAAKCCQDLALTVKADREGTCPCGSIVGPRTTLETWNDMPDETLVLVEKAHSKRKTSCKLISPTHQIDFNLQTREQMSIDWGNTRTVRKNRRVLIDLQGATVLALSQLALSQRRPQEPALRELVLYRHCRQALQYRTWLFPNLSITALFQACTWRRR